MNKQAQAEAPVKTKTQREKEKKVLYEAHKKEKEIRDQARRMASKVLEEGSKADFHMRQRAIITLKKMDRGDLEAPYAYLRLTRDPVLKQG